MQEKHKPTLNKVITQTKQEKQIKQKNKNKKEKRKVEA